MVETETCFYELEATKICFINEKSPLHRLEKLNNRFESYRGMWLTEKLPNYSKRMQAKVEKLATKMQKKYSRDKSAAICLEEDSLRFVIA